MVQQRSTVTITGVVNGSEKTITLTCGSITHGLDKQLLINPIPNKGQDDTLTWLIDLQRCKEAVTVVGNIVYDPTNQSYTAAGSGSAIGENKDNPITPLGQRRILIDMMRKQNADLTLRWGEDVGGTGDDTDNYETMVGSIQKMDIKELPGKMENYNNDSQTLPSHKYYSVQFVFVRGTIKG